MLAELAQLAGLHATDGQRFIGRYRGFPMRIASVGARRSAASPGGVLAIGMHLSVGGDALLTDDAWPARLAESHAGWEFELATAERSLWLTRACAGASATDLLAELDRVIDELAAAGFQGTFDCVDCGKSGVENVILERGALLTVCPECAVMRVAQRHEESAASRRVGVGFAMKAIGAAPFLAIPIAALWAGLWIGFALIVDWFHSGRDPGKLHVPVPVLAELIVMIVLGVIVGLPTAVGVKFLAPTSQRECSLAAVLILLFAAFFGEIGFTLYLLSRYAASGVPWWRAMPVLWGTYGFTEWLFRIAMLGMEYAVAMGGAGGKKKGA